MRSPIGIVLGALLVATGVALGIRGFLAVGDLINAMQRVPAGDGVFHAAAGPVTFYIEPTAVHADHPPRADVDCTLSGASGTVALTRPSARSRYTVSAHSGIDIFDARIPQAGDYTMQCTTGSRLPFVIAMGSGFGLALVTAILGMLLPAFAGIALVIVSVIRMRRARRRAHLEGPPDGPSPFPPRAR